MADIEAAELVLEDRVYDVAVAGPDDGELVVFLHGFPETGWSWRSVQGPVADAGYRTVAPDQRGYSPRARPTDDAEYTIDHLVGDVLGFADALGADRFHLVGHDWGGAVAWQVAGRHPDRLRSLTVASTPHPEAFGRARAAGPSADGDDQGAKSSYMQTFREPGAEQFFCADDAAVLKALYEGSGLDPEAAAHYVEVLGEPDAMRAALAWYRAASPDDSAGIGPITTPTLYVWSTDDIALGRTAAEGTAACVEGPYRFEVLDGISHWIPEAAPEAFTAHLLAHLASV